MNGFYTHYIGDPGTHLHCISNIDVLALEYVFSNPNPSPIPSAGGGQVVPMRFDMYGDTCEPPPPDWRAQLLEVAPHPDHPVSDIDDPMEGQSLSELDGIAGTAAARIVRNEFSTDVGIARRSGSRCTWWSASAERWSRPRACNKPVWNRADGDRYWHLPLKVQPQPGRYVVRSRTSQGQDVEPCCVRGQNLIHFDVVRSERPR